MKYCLAIKSSEVLIHAMTGMNLASVMLSEKNQIREVIICCHSYEMSSIGKSVESECRLVVARDMGEESDCQWVCSFVGEYMGDNNESILEFDSDDCTTW